MKSTGSLISAVAAVFLFWGSLSAQDELDAIRPWYGFTGGNPITTAIGHASVAAGLVIPDMGSNPANLGLHRFRIFSLGYYSSSFSGNSRSLSQNGLSNFQLIFPFPVYQGSLVGGIGYDHEHEFALSYDGGSFALTEKGGLKSLYAALAFEYEKNLFLGANIKYLYGYDETLDLATDGSTKDLLEPSYSGISFGFGILNRMGPFINTAISIDYPATISTDEKYTHVEVTDSATYTYSDNYQYSVSQAPTIRGGAALLLHYVNFFYEAEYCFWNSLKFSSDGIIDEDGLDADIGINRMIEDNLRPVLSHSFGIALHTPFVPLHFYAGYRILPEPTADYVKTGISGGFSYLLRQQLSISCSWQQQSWEYDGSQESWAQSALSVSIHF